MGPRKVTSQEGSECITLGSVWEAALNATERSEMGTEHWLWHSGGLQWPSHYKFQLTDGGQSLKGFGCKENTNEGTADRAHRLVFGGDVLWGQHTTETVPRVKGARVQEGVVSGEMTARLMMTKGKLMIQEKRGRDWSHFLDEVSRLRSGTQWT